MSSMTPQANRNLWLLLLRNLVKSVLIPTSMWILSLANPFQLLVFHRAKISSLDLTSDFTVLSLLFSVCQSS